MKYYLINFLTIGSFHFSTFSCRPRYLADSRNPHQWQFLCNISLKQSYSHKTTESFTCVLSALGQKDFFLDPIVELPNIDLRDSLRGKCDRHFPLEESLRSVVNLLKIYTVFINSTDILLTCIWGGVLLSTSKYLEFNSPKRLAITFC